ncbi:MAG: hypothetical protein EXR58_02855 [Chloroflexi bacterium]|nr:hypothetical protein [Chloroflexota bacterium]
MQETTTRVAIYARVSTEDQAERQTVKGQLTFLRDFCRLYSYEIAGEYVDEGVSGAKRLTERPEGQRLLDDAKTGAFGQVLVYRLDRLGRSLSSLLEAHHLLEGAGVAIRSATEPFDTGSSIGRFVFQLLGSIAELERETITERMTMGRARSIRDGKYTGGAALPYGYDVDDEGYIVPSLHMVLPLGITEADLVHDLFERVANGSTLIQEARRLNALGMSPVTRVTKKARREAVGWRGSRLSMMLRSPVYKGEHTMNFKDGTSAMGAVPPIVTPELWDKTRAALRSNMRGQPANAKRDYLLRGLMVCDLCGHGFGGLQLHVQQAGGRKTLPYYKCSNQVASNNPGDISLRCSAKNIRADFLEDLVWGRILDFLRDPGEFLRQAREQMAEPKSPAPQERREALARQLVATEAQKARVLALYRRGTVSLPDTESQLAEIAREASAVQTMIDAISVQDDLAVAEDAALTQTADLIQLYAANLDNADFALKRKLVELLVEKIIVETVPSGTKDKKATVTVVYAAVVGGESPAVTATSIIQYRQANGPFTRVEQLRDARVVNASVFDRIKDLVAVE